MVPDRTGMQTQKMQERRQFIRLPVRLNTRYTIVTTGERAGSLTKDTSGDGIGLFTEALINPGTVLNIEVKFPDRQQPVTFTGQVIWSGKLIHDNPSKTTHKFEAGLRFLKISPEDQQYVLRFSMLNAPSVSPSP